MIRRSLSFYISTIGYRFRPFAKGQDFIDELPHLAPGSVILDIRMPGMDGLQVLQAMGRHKEEFPVIVMTGHGDIATAVSAMRNGAHDFIEKPYEEEALLRALQGSFTKLQTARTVRDIQSHAQEAINGLSPREYEVLCHLANGEQNKVIANHMSLSVRTIEMHRARMMHSLDVRSLGDALRIFYEAKMIQSSVVE